MGVEILVPIAFFVMIVMVAIGMPVARAYARRLDRSTVSKFPSEVAARMERMEQALDSIAIEVERISEGQRFTTRLLSERSGETAPRGPGNEQRQ
jgi:hypothetical protein